MIYLVLKAKNTIQTKWLEMFMSFKTPKKKFNSKETSALTGSRYLRLRWIKTSKYY